MIPYRTITIGTIISEKRHRLANDEIPEGIHGLRLPLIELLKDRKNVEEAEIAYRCFTRLFWDKPGRPKYENFSWDYLSYLVIAGEGYIKDVLKGCASCPFRINA